MPEEADSRPRSAGDYLDPLLPWTGVKDSGKGGSLSHVGFGHLTRPKSFHLRARTRP